MTREAAPPPCRGSRRCDQSGSASVELALLVPALVIMLGLLVGGGRLWLARTAVTEAAQSAARSASLARSAPQASADGIAAGRESLSTAELSCLDQSIAVDTGAFAVAVGQPATITSNVRCTVPFEDVFLPGMPGSITVEGKGSSALDTYRSRR
jgi:Flp pilus assembly protein TadG